MGKDKSYAERAASCRRLAKVARISSRACWVLAVVFFVSGVGVGFSSGWQTGGVIILSAVLMTSNGVAFNGSAEDFARTAKTWDRLSGDLAGYCRPY